MVFSKDHLHHLLHELALIVLYHSLLNCSWRVSSGGCHILWPSHFNCFSGCNVLLIFLQLLLKRWFLMLSLLVSFVFSSTISFLSWWFLFKVCCCCPSLTFILLNWEEDCTVLHCVVQLSAFISCYVFIKVLCVKRPDLLYYICSHVWYLFPGEWYYTPQVFGMPDLFPRLIVEKDLRYDLFSSSGHDFYFFF